MRVLRIKLSQKKAHYKKEETITNKMTYPLPPLSTVIGALHDACKYKTYHPMDLSIQGKYESMQKEVYTDHGLLNSVLDDRGILIKLSNPEKISAGYKIIAKALKGQGNSFEQEVTIDVNDREGLDEYKYLRNKKNEIEEYKNNVVNIELDKLKKEIKEKKSSLKNLDKKTEDYIKLKKEVDILSENEKKVKTNFDSKKRMEYDMPYSYFANLTKGPKFYEVLYNVELIIHVNSDEETLQKIYDNRFNLKSIGRSEDFIDLKEMKFVDLTEEIDDIYANRSYSAYIKEESIKNESIFISEEAKEVNHIPTFGTKYYINKNYELKNNKRIFTKKKVYYISDYEIDNTSRDIYLDVDEENKYIVDLI